MANISKSVKLGVFTLAIMNGAATTTMQPIIKTANHTVLLPTLFISIHWKKDAKKKPCATSGSNTKH